MARATAPTTSTARSTRSNTTRFIAALLAADAVAFHEWEKDTPYFEGCLPIEVMAARGPDTLRWGPMKPIGLTDPRTGRGSYAVVQLRQDNALGTLYNIVGFQTKLPPWRADPHLPHDPRPGAGGIRTARRPSPQHIPQQPAHARRRAAAEGDAAPRASPARSPASRAMSKARRSGSWPAASPPLSGWDARRMRRRPTRRSARFSRTSPAAPMPRRSSR